MRFQEGPQRRQQHHLAELPRLAAREGRVLVNFFLAVSGGVYTGLNP